MENKNFRYYLRTVNGATFDWLSLNSSGNVIATTSLTPINPLDYLPMQWAEQILNWERKFPDAGMIRTFTVPLTFVKDGAKILKYYNALQGAECKMELYIEWYNNELSTLDWEFIYKGELSFIGFDSNKDGVSIEVTDLNILDAKETTDYEIDVVDSSEVIWVKLHECKLSFRQKWISPPGSDVNTFPYHAPLLTEGTNITLDIATEDPSDPIINLVRNFTAISQDLTLTYNYNYNVFVPGAVTVGAPYKFHLYYSVINVATNLAVASYDIFNTTPYVASGGSQTFVGQNVQVITLPANHKIIVLAELETTTGAPGTVADASYTCTQLYSTLDVYIDQPTPVSYFPCRRQIDVYKELVRVKMSDNTINAISDLLENTHPDKLLTSGDANRNLPHSKIKTNFADFKKAMNCAYGTTFHFNKSTNSSYIEPTAFAFDNTQCLDIGEVSNFTWKNFTSEMFTKLTNGYPAQTYDNVNGKDEPNTETIWQTACVMIKNDRDAVSGYYADKTGLLLNSLNLEGKTSTDADSDNRIWMLHADMSAVAGTIPAGYAGAGADYYDLYRDPGLTITNVYDPTNLFNVFYSPKRCLLRKGDFFKSIFYGLWNTLIKFQTKSKSNATDTQMVTDDGTTVIDEGEDILISNLDSPLFQPFFFEFNAIVPLNFYTIVNTTPFQYIKGTSRGREFKGFIMKAGQDTYKKDMGKFIVLATPDMDLDPFITI